MATFYNKATQELIAPGSTFKPLSAIAGLTEGVISPNTTIACNGPYENVTPSPTCWVYPGGHGSVNVVSGIANSCNCYFYELGPYMGIEKMNYYCSHFGLGQPTGIEIGEEIGILAGPEHSNKIGKRWREADTVMAAIGQSENAFTPLQVSMYIASVVNGGTRYAATLLHSVHEFGKSEPAVKSLAEMLNTIPLSSSTVNTIKKAMKEVIFGDETAWNITSNFNDAPYDAGGKTGTAQNPHAETPATTTL